MSPKGRRTGMSVPLFLLITAGIAWGQAPTNEPRMEPVAEPVVAPDGGAVAAVVPVPTYNVLAFVDDYVTFGTGSPISADRTQFSCGAWIRGDAIGDANYRVFLCWSNGDGQRAIEIGTFGSQIYYAIANDGAATVRKFAQNVFVARDGKWRHVTLTFNAGTVALYHNFVAVAHTPLYNDSFTEVNNSTGDVRVGQRLNGATPERQWVGSVTLPFFYPIALDAAGVAALNTVNLPGSPSIEARDAASATWYDRSGNARNGTLGPGGAAPNVGATQTAVPVAGATTP